MNEQIKHLAKKAGYFYNYEKQENGDTWVSEIDKPGTGGNLEKFAQLMQEEHERLAQLMQEEYEMLARIKSLSIMRDANKYATNKVEFDAAKAMAWEFRVFADEIKEHFGVEE